MLRCTELNWIGRCRAILALLVLTAAACGSSHSRAPDGHAPADGQDSIDGQMSAAMGRLRVEGNRIVDPSGHALVLQGLGLGDALNVDESGHFNEDYFRHASAWGAKLVRLPITPTLYRMGADRVFSYVDRAAAWARQYGFYLIIEWHVSGNLQQGIFLFGDTGITVDETRQFWTAVASRYTNDPVVAFYELFNEPAVMEWEGGSWSWTDWRSTADALVTLVRSLSPETIPVLSGFDFAYDYSAGGVQPFASTDIALAVHPYPGRSRPPRTQGWDQAFGYLSDTYPLLFTEVGYDPCDQIVPDVYQADIDYGREILSYAKQKGIGWTAFVFYKAPDWPMPLFSDWQSYAPTTSGMLFHDVLLGTPIEQAGRASTGCPSGTGSEGLDGGVVSDSGATNADVSIITAPGVTVNLAQPKQTMDGFGISTSWAPALSDTEADALFDPSRGIGLSILRVGMGSTGEPISSNIYSDIKKAKARGVATFMATALSAPGDCKQGGHLVASCYDSWATTMAAFADKVKQNTGTDLSAVSVQNEPDYASGDSSSSMLYTADEMVAFIKALGPKLKSLSPPVKLLAPETTEWGRLWTNQSASGASDPLAGKYDYGYVLAKDPDAWAQVGAVATHMYDTQAAAPWPSDVPDRKPLWMTEVCGVKGWPEVGPSSDINNGIAVAGWIHDAIANGDASAWLWFWYRANDTDDNEGLLLKNGTDTKRHYTLGNFSKFVRPGYTRLEVAGPVPSDVLVTAYKSPGDALVIVAINRGDATVNLPIAISGGTLPASLTPWVTSASDNLAQQDALTVSGSSFTATLAGMTVTTFVAGTNPASGRTDAGISDSGPSEPPTVAIRRAGGAPISPFAFGNNYYDWVDWSNNGTCALLGTEAPVKAMHLNTMVLSNNNTDMNYPEIFDNAQIDKFITYCRAVGAEPIMEIPMAGNNIDGGPMSAQLAADMVTYVNGTKGYGVKYWTIGDEADLYVSGNIIGDPNPYLGPNCPIKTADDLCAVYGSYAAAMKAANEATGSGVDLKFVGPELGWRYLPGNDWLTPFLDGCKDYVDVVSVHWYGYSGTTDSIQGALNGADSFRSFLSFLQGLVASHARPGTPIGITETAVSYDWQTSVYSSDALKAAPGTYYAALWDIDAMGVALQANLWTLAFWNLAEPDDPSSDNIFGNIRTQLSSRPPTYTLTPEYYAQQLMAGSFSGTTVTPSGVPDDFSVYASYDATKASTTIIVVNKKSVAAPLTIAVDSLPAQTMPFDPLAITLVTVPDDPTVQTSVVEYSPDLAAAGQPPRSIR